MIQFFRLKYLKDVTRNQNKTSAYLKSLKPAAAVTTIFQLHPSRVNAELAGLSMGVSKSYTGCPMVYKSGMKFPCLTL
jgi:hypothetical protein